MARYPLSLPVQLKQEAETLATQQGVSLNQFILWAVAEKVGSLNNQLDDPTFPQITYRRGAVRYPRACFAWHRHPCADDGRGNDKLGYVAGPDSRGVRPSRTSSSGGIGILRSP